MRYRKIVREVEAYQLTAAMIDAHLLDEAPLPKGLRLARAGYHRGNRVVYNATFSVTTIHGEDARVVVNDWIITEMDGEHFYPCKPEIFAVDYEAVGAPHPGLGSGALRERLCERITSYLTLGGLFNAELMNHDAVRELLSDCRVGLSLSSPIEQRGEIYRLGVTELAAMIRCEYPDFDENHVSESLARIAARPTSQASSEIREARLKALEEARQLCITEKNAWRKLERWLPADAADNCEIGIRALIKETEALAPSRQGAGGK